jgi:hypothetical protein
LKRVPKKDLPFLEQVTRKNKKSGRMFTLVSCASQRIETEVVLLRLTKKFYQRVKDSGLNTYAVSIHDAVIFEEEHLVIFNQVFEEVFEEIGLKNAPKLDIQPLYKYDINIKPSE